MDPLTSSGLFATIVGLLCNYKSERSSTDLNEFMSWLEEKHHETTAASIRNNAELEISLTSLLNIKHEKLVDHLQRLDILITSIAGKLDEFSGIAKAVHKEAIFSDQAVSILTQLVDSGAKFFVELQRDDNNQYFLDGSTGKELSFTAPRLIEDDLNILIFNKLLSNHPTPSGKRKFYVTNAAVSFVTELKKSSR